MAIRCTKTDRSRSGSRVMRGRGRAPLYAAVATAALIAAASCYSDSSTAPQAQANLLSSSGVPLVKVQVKMVNEFPGSQFPRYAPAAIITPTLTVVPAGVRQVDYAFVVEEEGTLINSFSCSVRFVLDMHKKYNFGPIATDDTV